MTGDTEYAERQAACAIDDVRAQRHQWQRQNRRPRALSAREALAALQFECLLVWIYGGNLLAGMKLTEDDRERVSVALRRIDALTEEAIG